MATRYWVGPGAGSPGTWDTTTTSNWSATSGGATGASAPTSADDVIFDSASNNPNVTCTGAVCATLTINSTSSTSLSLHGTLNATNFTAISLANQQNKCYLGGTLNFSGAFTVTSSSVTQRFLFTRYNPNISATINAASKSLSGVDFYGITAGGAAAPFSGTSIGNGGGNTNITGATPKTVYWSLLAGGNFTSTAFATSSGGVPALANFPLPQDTLIIDDAGLTTANIINFDTGQYSLPNTTSTRVNAWEATGTGNFYGDLTLTDTFTNTFFGGNFYGINKALTIPILSINSAVIGNISGIFSINGSITGTFRIESGGTAKLLKNISLVNSDTTLSSGTLDLNNFTLRTKYCLITGSVGNTSIAFGSSGQIILSPFVGTTSQTIFTSVASGFSYTGTSNVLLTSAQASNYIYTFTVDSATTESQALNFTFGGTGAYRVVGPAVSNNITFATGCAFNVSTKTIYGNLTLFTSGGFVTGTNVLTFAGASGTKTITTNGRTFATPVTFNGNCTWQFADALIMGSTRTLTIAQGTVQLKAGTTNTVQLFATTGTTLKYLASTTAGTQATISSTSGTNSVTYLDIKDSNATGGAVWSAIGPTNVDGGNNSGWLFSVSINVLISESLSLQDASNATQNFIIALSEVLGLADSSVLATTFAIAASEGITLADTPIAGTAFVSSILENLVVSELPAVLKTFNVSISEPQTIQDAANVIAAYISAISEPTTIQESIIGVAAKIITNVTEALTVSNAQTAVVSFVSNINEGIIVADNEATTKTQYAIIVEPLTLNTEQNIFAWVKIENIQSTQWVLIDNRQ